MGQTASNLEDKYFLQKVKLGEGSFGVVWRGKEKSSNATVAIKQIDIEKLKTRGGTREDIMREISMMKLCRHENITELYDTFEENQYISLALEYCDGGDFGDKVKERAVDMQEREAAEWARQICSAIAALHCKGICHRDIKPDNFMVSGNQLKLADFGLAVQPQSGELLRVRCGTPAFMAPEQLRLPGGSGYSYPVDMWAAGVTLYMLICGGKHPFINDGGNFDEKKCLAGALDFSVHERAAFQALMGKPQRFTEAPRALARRLVEPDREKRITAQAALEDPWLSTGTVPGAYAQAHPAVGLSNQANSAGAAGPSQAQVAAAFPMAVDAAPSGAAVAPRKDATAPPAGPPGAVTTMAAVALLAPVAIAAIATSPEWSGTPSQGEVPARSSAAPAPAPKRRSTPPGPYAGGAANAVAQPVGPAGVGAAAPNTGAPAAWEAPASVAAAPAAAFVADAPAPCRAPPPVSKPTPREPAPRAKMQLDDRTVTIVMVGPTGQGKSTLGNVLTSGVQFKTSDDFDSETLDCAHADFSFDTRPHRAIDTIGFLDTRMDASENMDKFACFADRAPAGIDAFVFVLKKGRFTEQSLGQIKAFQSVAGESAMKHTILVFTHCGDETNDALRSRCESSTNQHLKDAVNSCASILGVDSLATHRCEDDRISILNSIKDLIRSNHGVKYDNATLNEARQRRMALLDKIQGLSAERRDAMSDKIDALFNGRLTFDQVSKAVDDAVEHEEAERKAAAERISLQALLAAAKSEASAWKQVAQNALRGAAGSQAGNSLGLAGCCAPVAAQSY